MNFYINQYQAMLNVAKWIRQMSNSNIPGETTVALVGAYEFLYDLAYGNCDWNMGINYLNYGPETVDGVQHSYPMMWHGLNRADRVKFSNKSKFLKRFIKGTRPLMH
jgi:hypothetical protein